MSIESLLDRIAKAQERTADALEKLLSQPSDIAICGTQSTQNDKQIPTSDTTVSATASQSAPTPVASTPATPQNLEATAPVQNQPTAPAPTTTNAAPAPQAAPAPSQPQTASVSVPAPQTAPVTLTMEELNTELVKEFYRLGGSDSNREPYNTITSKMVDLYGEMSVQNIPAEKYSELLEAVRGIPNA